MACGSRRHGRIGGLQLQGKGLGNKGAGDGEREVTKTGLGREGAQQEIARIALMCLLRCVAHGLPQQHAI